MPTRRQRSSFLKFPLLSGDRETGHPLYIALRQRGLQIVGPPALVRAEQHPARNPGKWCVIDHDMHTPIYAMSDGEKCNSGTEGVGNQVEVGRLVKFIGVALVGAENEAVVGLRR